MEFPKDLDSLIRIIHSKDKQIKEKSRLIKDLKAQIKELEAENKSWKFRAYTAEGIW